MATRMDRVEQIRPLVEVITRDMATLNGAHESIRDGLEQVRAAYSEMTKLRERQTEIDGYLSDADQRMVILKEHVAELERMRPAAEALGAQVEALTASTTAVESRREVVDALHQKVGELESSVAQLDERG